MKKLIIAIVLAGFLSVLAAEVASAAENVSWGYIKNCQRIGWENCKKIQQG